MIQQKQFNFKCKYIITISHNDNIVRRNVLLFLYYMQYRFYY